jgi:dethiobiotin synthetase
VHGIFVTGTDTGVGKTYVGAMIIQALTARGITVIPRKPVESGCKRKHGSLFPADAEALCAAAGRNTNLGDVCSYRFEKPISPARAARLQGMCLTINDLELACLRGTDSNSFVWMEGAGGFYSPLATDGLNADLAARLGFPVLLIAADRLGCINHVLLTTEAIRTRRLLLMGVILNRLPGDTAYGMDNGEDLRQWLSCPVFSFSYRESADAAQSCIAQVIEALT